MEICRSAKVLASSGFHSRKFVGRTGVAVAKLVSGQAPSWVLLFSTGIPSNEEGLYAEDELQWIGGH